MNNSNTLHSILPIVLALCLGIGGFFIGKSNAESQANQEKELLQSLNRSSIENMILEGEGPIYVIGHKSPDTDTVCSAIAYAELLSKLGYTAEPRITMQPNNETLYVLSQAKVEVPAELADASGKNIFLVDHSEYAQSTEGMQDAHIVGVIDHHGIGNVSTGHQVVYEARPIGCTSTIIWLDYLNYGVEVDPQTACLMMGAILSDTDNLAGSTTTEADRKAIETLSKIAGIEEVDAFYTEMHKQKLSFEGMSDQDILFSDYKEYEASGTTFGIGTVAVLDEESAKDLSQRMQKALPEGFATHNVDLMYAQMSIRENGEKIEYIVPANEYSKEVFEAAFPDYDEFDGTAYIFRKGLGRKTLFVPGLTTYLGTHPKE